MNDQHTSRSPALRGRLGLAVLMVIVGLVWLVVLPAIQAHPAVQSRIDFQEQRGIDPSAMFYTDVDFIDSRRSR